MRNFHTRTDTPPAAIPRRAPVNVALFQNRASITTGPKLAPKPAHANDTIWNTEDAGSRAIIIPRIAMMITVTRAASMLVFEESLSFIASWRIFSDTLEDAASN